MPRHCAINRDTGSGKTKKKSKENDEKSITGGLPKRK